MNKGIIIALVVVLFAGGSYWLYRDRQAANDQPEVSNSTEDQQGLPVETGEPLEKNFILAMGEEKRVDAMRIKFEEVVQDSRCPSDVQCIQAGSATLRFNVEGQPVTLELPGSAATPNAVVVGSYIITLVGVDPAEKLSTVTTNPADYKATLRVETHDVKG